MKKIYFRQNVNLRKVKNFVKTINFNTAHRFTSSPWIYYKNKNFKFTYALLNNSIIGVSAIFETQYNLHLSFLYVSEKYRGKGLGQILLKRFILKNKKLKTVHVYKNLKKTLNFYKKNNFKKFSFKSNNEHLKKWRNRCINFDKETFKKRFLLYQNS